MRERLSGISKQYKKTSDEMRVRKVSKISVDTLGCKKLHANKGLIKDIDDVKVQSWDSTHGGLVKSEDLPKLSELQTEMVKGLLQNNSESNYGPEKDGDGVEIVFRPRSIKGKQEVESSKTGNEKERIKGKKVKKGKEK